MDCILARSIKIHKVKRRKAAKPLDTPVKMFTYIGLHRAQRTTITLPADTSIAGIGSDKNWKQNCLGLLPVKTPVDDSFRACIVLIPNAGVFYCHRERRKETAGVTNSYIPMDINWLRLCCNSKSTSVLNNWFSEGSYVLRIADGDCCVWKWSVQRSESNLLPANCGIVGLTPGLRDKCIHKMYQLTDEDSPALSPDFVDSKDLSTWVECDRLTGLYRRAYCKSNSARRGCRHYARGFPHKNMDPKATFVIDPTKCTEMDLLCCGAHQTLQQKGGIAPTLSGSDLLPTCCCWWRLWWATSPSPNTTWMPAHPAFAWMKRYCNTNAAMRRLQSAPISQWLLHIKSYGHIHQYKWKQCMGKKSCWSVISYHLVQLMSQSNLIVAVCQKIPAMVSFSSRWMLKRKDGSTSWGSQQRYWTTKPYFQDRRVPPLMSHLQFLLQ